MWGKTNNTNSGKRWTSENTEKTQEIFFLKKGKPKIWKDGGNMKVTNYIVSVCVFFWTT